MGVVVAVTVHRNCVGLVACKPWQRRGAFEAHMERASDASLPEIVDRILRELPAQFRRAPLRVALSWADLACADSFPAPTGVKPRLLNRLAPSLCEARCAGECAEDLSMDIVQRHGGLQAVAIRTETLRSLQKVADQFRMRLALVTAIPCVLAAGVAEGPLELVHGGERIVVNRDGWRCAPAASESPACVQWNGAELQPKRAAAVALAFIDPDAVPDALRGAPGAPRSLPERIKAPLAGLVAACALLVFAIGFRFQRQAEIHRSEIESLDYATAALWRTYLPDRKPDGDLVRAMRGRISGQGTVDSDAPSAVELWAEIAVCWPDADALGLFVEGLDLTPEGARLNARLPMLVGDDPLRHAARLESDLNRSSRISARGDFEIREGQVKVRLRVDRRREGASHGE